jgi:hypothetical protein
VSIPEATSKSRFLYFLERSLRKLKGLREVQVGNDPTITPYSYWDDLVVASPDNHAGINIIAGGASGFAGLALGREDNSNPLVGYLSAGATAVTLGSFQAGHYVDIDVQGVSTLRADANYQVAMPWQPAVSARMNASQAFASSYTALQTVKYDPLSTPGFEVGYDDDYDPSTGVYTAGATAGKYLISTSVMLTGCPKASTLRLACLTSKSAAAGIVMYADRLQGTDFTWTTAADMTYPIVQGTWLVDLAATETAQVQVQATAGDSGTSILGHASSVYTWLYIVRVT